MSKNSVIDQQVQDEEYKKRYKRLLLNRLFPDVEDKHQGANKLIDYNRNK